MLAGRECRFYSYFILPFNLVFVSRKMRSDQIVKDDPRAQVLIAPPGADPKDYGQMRGSTGRGRRASGRGRGRRARGE